MNKSILITFLILICWGIYLIANVFAGEVSKESQPKAVEGVLDLADWNLEEDGPVTLYGEWEFYWEHLLTPEDFRKNNDGSELQNFNCYLSKAQGYMKVPGWWENETGYGTYKLTILLEEQEGKLAMSLPYLMSSYKMWVNGDLIATNGEVGISKEESSAEWKKKAVSFPVKDDTVEVILQVSNFQHRLGGIWENYLFGLPNQITQQRELNLIIDAFMRGAIIIMALYHLSIFFLRRKELSALYFGMICFAGALRLLTDGEVMITDFLAISWEWHYKLLLISIAAGAVFFHFYLQSLYPEEIPRSFSRNIAIPAGIIFLLFILIVPVMTISLIENYLMIIVILFLICHIYWLVLAARNKRPGVNIFILNGVIFFLFALNDFLLRLHLIQSVYLLQFGVLIIVFSQAYLLSSRFASSYKNIELLSEDLMNTNRAYSRFVPSEFLSFLNKDNIVNIELGNQVETEMTLLFSDIRSFTSISEKMTPEENFNFLNRYLKEMGPIIRSNNGFIDKYIGDSIMALFPDDPEDALKAAIEMQKKTESLNVELAEQNYPPIRAGIGIHAGKMILGTIGEAERMEGTVISDTVNLASRLEKLTKDYGTGVIMSRASFDNIDDKQRYRVRFIGKIAVTGKIEEVEIIEVLDELPSGEMELKLKTKDLFQEALFNYYKANYEKAASLLKEVLEKNPDDKIAKLFLDCAYRY